MQNEFCGADAGVRLRRRNEHGSYRAAVQHQVTSIDKYMCSVLADVVSVQEPRITFRFWPEICPAYLSRKIWREGIEATHEPCSRSEPKRIRIRGQNSRLNKEEKAMLKGSIK
jgi:hypothetical protein